LRAALLLLPCAQSRATWHRPRSRAHARSSIRRSLAILTLPPSPGLDWLTRPPLPPSFIQVDRLSGRPVRSGSCLRYAGGTAARLQYLNKRAADLPDAGPAHLPPLGPPRASRRRNRSVRW